MEEKPLFVQANSNLKGAAVEKATNLDRRVLFFSGIRRSVVPGRKEQGRWNADMRSLVQLWCGVGLELVRLSALDPLSGEEKSRIVNLTKNQVE